MTQYAIENAGKKNEKRMIVNRKKQKTERNNA